MKNTPYTVLMSVYIKEKAEYLKLSIQSMLDQTVPPDEFILVKDGPLTMELDIAKFMRRRCAILHPTVMYKKGAVIRSGNYHSVPLYEDYDLFARMVLEYNVRSYNIQENLYYIRTSEDFFKRRGGLKYAKTVLNFKWNHNRFELLCH